MAITEEEVARVAGLARLRLDPEERRRMTRELSAILDYVAKLDELDLEGVAPMTHVEVSGTPLRADQDEPVPFREQALRAAPEQAEGHFRVPRVV